MSPLNCSLFNYRLICSLSVLCPIISSFLPIFNFTNLVISSFCPFRSIFIYIFFLIYHGYFLMIVLFIVFSIFHLISYIWMKRCSRAQMICRISWMNVILKLGRSLLIRQLIEFFYLGIWSYLHTNLPWCMALPSY